jgi:ADP-ribosylglycohydrolase
MSDSEEHEQPVRKIRLHHPKQESGREPSRPSPFSWLSPVATRRREKSVEGLLYGCAVAEALAQAHNGLPPRVGLKLYGRNPLEYRYQPGVGITSHRTHALIITTQAMLESRTDKDRFANSLRKRISWYQRSFPVRHVQSFFSSIVRKCRNVSYENSLELGFGDDPMVRSLILAVGLQGGMNNFSRWLEKSVDVTHGDFRVLHAATLTAYAAQIAQLHEGDTLDPFKTLGMLIDATDEPDLLDQLRELESHLRNHRSVAFVAKQFGWGNGVPADVMAVSLLGIYSWLRHPTSYRNAVERAVLLGGSCSAVAVLAGSLAGITLGRNRIPRHWTKDVSFFPYDKAWREQLIERVKDWPHGVEDIQEARGLPSQYLGQIARNTWRSVFRLIHAAIRLPVKSVAFSLRKKG